MSLRKRIRKFFQCRCPKCKALLDEEFLDLEINKIVYRCTRCGKRWVIL